MILLSMYRGSVMRMRAMRAAVKVMVRMKGWREWFMGSPVGCGCILCGFGGEARWRTTVDGG